MECETRLGDTGVAECRSCGREWFHTYGAPTTTHKCACGGELVCGIKECLDACRAVPDAPSSGTATTHAAETPLHVPSDPKARYYVLENLVSGAERTIVTKRVGPSGTSHSKRLYNCEDDTVKYLGTGDSLEEMAASKPDPSMGPIIPGSIAYYIGVEACR